MRRLSNNKGFTLIEMIIVMAIFVIVIVVTGDAFNRIVSKAISLSRTSESNISGIVGLEIMRSDLESAGYGLPWSFASPIAYSEAIDDPGVALNDANRAYPATVDPDQSQQNIPRAVMSTDNIVSADKTVVMSGTDVLTVRAQTIATNPTDKRWTYVESAVLPTVNPSPAPHTWSSDNLQSTDRVVVIQPVTATTHTNQLVVNGTTWTAPFNNYSTIGKPPVYNDAEGKSDAYIIYGVDGDTDLRMPFNRADFYVRQPAATEQGWVRLPARCNPSTGVLFKGVVSQSTGHYQELPLLECVLDMQVVYSILQPGSASISYQSDISGFTPKMVREQVKEVKVYILTHDGGKDSTYTYPNSTVGVGPGDGKTSGTGRTYDFVANNIPNWQNYHWRVYQLTARPNNLAGNVAQ